MVKNNSRICDVCGEEIPKGTRYRIVRAQPEAADIFLQIGDIEMTPTWTQNKDGTIRLDVCLDCSISMGGSSVDEAIN